MSAGFHWNAAGIALEMVSRSASSRGASSRGSSARDSHAAAGEGRPIGLECLVDRAADLLSIVRRGQLQPEESRRLDARLAGLDEPALVGQKPSAKIPAGRSIEDVARGAARWLRASERPRPGCRPKTRTLRERGARGG